MNNLKDAKKTLNSSGKFPFSSKLCAALPVAGLGSISTVRVMMALVWTRDVTVRRHPNQMIEIDLADLRSASGYADSGSYRDILDAISKIHEIAFVTRSGEVCEVFDFVGLREVEGGRSCCYRISAEFDALQTNVSNDGYGLINMEDVVRLARPLDLFLYLRLSAVRKRRLKSFELTRSELFCLTNRDPSLPIGVSVRAIKTSMARVCKILKISGTVESQKSLGADRTKSLKCIIT